jgi:predicted TIM-barrel fold metal-dependent hydrolase
MNVSAPLSSILPDQRLGIVDCDIHPRLGSMAELKPYLASRWWDYLQTYGLRKRHGFVKGHPFPKSQPGDGARRDAWIPGGGLPGSNLDFMRQQHLDPYNVEFGIMNPLSNGQDDQNSNFGAAVCSAVNDWQLRWSEQEPRLKSSICVAYEDAEAAREEIRKRSGNKHFAQILLMSRTSEALGRKRYWPIYELAVEYGLPIGIHVFGYSGWAASNSGWPSFYIEEMAQHETACSALVASMVVEGVFERFPTLKVVMIEAGFAWLPSLGWRLDKHWKHLKDEVPHLSRLPSDYIKSNFWISTQPMEEPERPAHLVDILDWIGDDRVLFASDYPHWDFDDPYFAIPQSLGRDRRRKIFSENAKKVYGLT